MSIYLKEIESYENQFPAGAIIDGVVDGSLYFKSKYRIAWFLKEAYSDESKGFHMRCHYDQDDSYQNFFRHKATQTWHPIIYASYSILNGLLKYDEMDWIKDKPEMCDVIKSVAIINANKLPSETGTYTLKNNLTQAFQNFENLIKRQVEVLRPNVHIFCGTFYLYKRFFELEDHHELQLLHCSTCSVYSKGGNLFLDVYHPANRQLQREKYVDQIVNAVEFWTNGEN